MIDSTAMFFNFVSALPTLQSPVIWLWLSPILLYAEMHYRLKFLKGRLYKKQPEIVFDAPRRIQSTDLPIVLLIKDAHWFPVILKEVRLKITSPFDNSICKEQVFKENLAINRQWFTREYFLDVSKDRDHLLNIDCRAFVECGGHTLIIQNDNYAGLSQAALEVFVDPETLPAESGWLWGDLHCHSEWTTDQVEFGLPLVSLPVLAGSMGLSYCGLVEHSYDLDDQPDSWTQNDEEVRKWLLFRQAVQAINDNYPDFCIIPGEEVTVDNGLGQNVHLAVLDNPEFFAGSGDGLEHSAGFASELSYQRVLEKADSQALIFAAHPFTQPPLSQRLIARRGTWNPYDHLKRLDGWQILNGQTGREFTTGRNFWIQKLLSGQRSFIYAGNDAHGNFNRFRQVQIPLLKMHEHNHQVFGEFMTGVKADLRTGRNVLIDNLKNGAVIVSNGPFINLTATDPQQRHYGIGQTLPNAPRNLKISTQSTNYYGAIRLIRLFIGNIERQTEEIKTFKISAGIYRKMFNFPLIDTPSSGYLRAEVETKSSKLALTNPIWFGNVTDPGFKEKNNS
ncbi:MAG: hypothetical protein WC611_00750 [Candidatus Neomarinimicrobiota bacterium]